MASISKRYTIILILIVIFFANGIIRMYNSTAYFPNINLQKISSLNPPVSLNVSTIHTQPATVHNFLHRKTNFKNPRKYIAEDGKSISWDRILYKPNMIPSKVHNLTSEVRWNKNIKHICDIEENIVLAVIYSAPTSQDRRNFIRHAWANFKYYNKTRLKYVFHIGATTNSSIQEDIDRESLAKNDIIQNNFIDSYRNLTLKSIATISWAYHYCNNTPFILKIDDDVLLQPLNLRNYLEKELVLRNSLNHIYGCVNKRGKPWRKGKYMVTVADYKPERYPDFIHGPSYIMGRNAIDRLHATIDYTKTIWLEDVYLTGLVAQKARVNLVNMAYYYVTIKPTRLFPLRIFWHGGRVRQRADAWKLFMRGNKVLNNLLTTRQLSNP